MLFFILDHHGNVMFSTLPLKEYYGGLIHSFFIENFNDIEKYKIGIAVKDDCQYQVGMLVKTKVMLAIIQPLDQVYHSKEIEEPILIEILHKIDEILDEEEWFILENDITRELWKIKEKIEKCVFPWGRDGCIRVIGDALGGKSTICNVLPGLSMVDAIETKTIPYNKTFGGKKIVFREYGLPGKHFVTLDQIRFAPYLLVVMDSTREENSITRNHVIAKINHLIELHYQGKILFLANKQDLPNAMKPETIEKIIGYPTVGFSAVAPDAPERLEEILTKFLKK